MGSPNQRDDKIADSPRRPPPLPPREGDTVGSYRLTKLLGSGGMGTVFLAQHLTIGRRVAIKFLLPELARYPDIVGRFFDEARSVNHVNHENIVEIFDFVRSPEGLSYIVMEFLEGLDLFRTRKTDGPYSVRRAIDVSEQVAAALGAAHAVGIVHRDLKPENVFLVKRRRVKDFVKLLDFGLAKLSETLPTSREPTQAGVVMGTPGYMAPEQALGAKVDARADIYSLGVLFQWMLSDRTPNPAPGEDVPQRNVLGEEIPQPIRDIIRRCRQSDPAQRPQSMQELVELLGSYRRDRTTRGHKRITSPELVAHPEASASSAPTRRGALRVFSAVAALVVGVGLAMGTAYLALARGPAFRHLESKAEISLPSATEIPKLQPLPALSRPAASAHPEGNDPRARTKHSGKHIHKDDVLPFLD